MKPYWALGGVLLLMTTGCAAAVVAGGAYKAATDERSIGRMWDDATITTKVKTELIKDPVTKGLKIDVDTLEGVVMLTGVVETEEEALQASKVARGVRGVEKVKNDLQIGTKTFRQSMDDQVVGSRIKAKLLMEPGIRSLNIDVDVHNGTVTLTGIVANGDQKKRIIEVARSAPGTARIIDNISVRNP